MADPFDSYFLLALRHTDCGVVAALWYGVALHGWSKDQYFLIGLGAVIPIMFLWYLVERAAWNHDLRRKGIASSSDVWGVDQFPPK